MVDIADIEAMAPDRHTLAVTPPRLVEAEH